MEGWKLVELYRYIHTSGLGEAARGESLDEDMKELDMMPGTEVEVIAHDEESDWPIVAWEDSTRNRRITTIDPDVFSELFEKVDTDS